MATENVGMMSSFSAEDLHLPGPGVGAELRPPPARYREERRWEHLRKSLYSPWVHVGDEWEESAYTHLLDEYMWRGDEIMDAVAHLFSRAGNGRAMFEQVLDGDVRSIPDAPQELVDLAEHLDRVPSWFDREASERGRRRLCAVSPMAKLAAFGFSLFAVTMKEDAAESTGATGQFKQEPLRRAVDTSRYFLEVTHPTALDRESERFKTIIRVRLMHALVRKGLIRRWGPARVAETGMPLSDASVAGGHAWFGTMPVVIDQYLGRPISMSDLDDVAMHWAYIAYLTGASAEILPKNGLDSIRLADHIFASAGRPVPRYRVQMAEALLYPTEALGGEAAIRDLIGATTAVVGTRDAQEWLSGTKYESLPLAELASGFRAVAEQQALVMRHEDEDPTTARSQDAFVDGDPDMTAAYLAMRDFAAERGVHVTEYTEHDGSTSGRSLGPAR
ncbi:oxygenase MpaB family protein [Pseudonocardia xishanensis]|uniref:Oxygenase MpaB family protein n=1 Tax=Pseudonocardia xishanensis TaxID=630995 RepID=A0ABP8REM2_9PSEU